MISVCSCPNTGRMAVMLGRLVLHWLPWQPWAGPCSRWRTGLSWWRRRWRRYSTFLWRWVSQRRAGERFGAGHGEQTRTSVVASRHSIKPAPSPKGQRGCYSTFYYFTFHFKREQLTQYCLNRSEHDQRRSLAYKTAAKLEALLTTHWQFYPV